MAPIDGNQLVPFDGYWVAPYDGNSAETKATAVFAFLVDVLLELTDPIAQPRMLTAHEVKELEDPDILQAIDQNPMNDDARIYVIGSENGQPFLANFIRGFRDPRKSLFPTMEAARSEFLEIWDIVNRAYKESDQ